MTCYPTQSHYDIKTGTDLWQYTLLMTASLADQSTSTMIMIIYPTQSHYPDTNPTHRCPILVMLSPRLGNEKYKFGKSSDWIGFGFQTRNLPYGGKPALLLFQPPRPIFLRKRFENTICKVQIWDDEMKQDVTVVVSKNNPWAHTGYSIAGLEFGSIIIQRNRTLPWEWSKNCFKSHYFVVK